ncbi:lysophospholipid acyltransferase family protein [Roseovarius sp. SCSIO 43702]|uniref:lysophospholipid acyltransferase family protein n=1 Tax=Roseovarius sp. SCSIO 43702 TaxID=2823043 RepID=UPI001C737544|nr:lysophospholipid acyltransferase family protein [Roseovarius sp. SCSIO 43702]QYX58624.1 lysophospholipid acyltransferase family protein [Roseovarius sp. SCSIO 43702]
MSHEARDATSEVVTFTKYDRRSLTYANTFDSPMTARVIRSVEWMTGKISIIRMIRAFEKRGAPSGQAFWRAALDTMGIELLTPQEEIDNIPSEGPVVVVANHPHGLVDGMILADLIGRRRTDYKILTRALLTGIDEVAASYMISVPFPHEPDAQAKSVAMRAKAMAHLREGGVISVFPSGVVASSDTLFGPVREAEWNVFTAQMIRRSGAKVVPIYFSGQNSRWYQMANRISATMRQSLLLHEVVRSCNRPQRPVVGPPVPDEKMDLLQNDPRGFMTWLRAHTLSLGAENRPATETE